MLALLALLTANARPAQAVGPYDPARSFAPLVEAVAPAVALVRIRVGGETHAGSGFVVDPSGTVLTAFHVIQGAESVHVTLATGQRYEAELLGGDAAMDIALLQLTGTTEPLPWLQLGDSEALRVGDRVLALGNPLGLGATVTAGIVSGTKRNLELDRYWRSDDFIQTDAAINKGNSGGPLVDLDGRAIGMNTSIIAGANTVGFAVPAERLRGVIPELRTHGKILRGFLGLDASRLTSAAADELAAGDGGALVYRLLPDGPAAAHGIQLGDVIVAVDERPVRNGADLLAAVGNTRPGARVRIDLVRDRERKRVTVTLGQRPADEP